MIYTVTFNPAVDYVVHTGEMKTGATNRSTREEIYFGGKGINVSIVLNELGIKSKALGFVAGFTGAAIESGVADMGIDTDFVRLENGFSRINVKIKSAEEIQKRHLKGLKSFGDDYPQSRRILVSLDRINRKEDGIELIYVHDFLAELWRGGII